MTKFFNEYFEAVHEAGVGMLERMAISIAASMKRMADTQIELLELTREAHGLNKARHEGVLTHTSEESEQLAKLVALHEDALATIGQPTGLEEIFEQLNAAQVKRTIVSKDSLDEMPPEMRQFLRVELHDLLAQLDAVDAVDAVDAGRPKAPADEPQPEQEQPADDPQPGSVEDEPGDEPVPQEEPNRDPNPEPDLRQRTHHHEPQHQHQLQEQALHVEHPQAEQHTGVHTAHPACHTDAEHANGEAA